MPLFLDAAIVKKLVDGPWHGKANRLSGEHGVHWDIIDEVADASWKTQADNLTVSACAGSPPSSDSFHARLAESKRASRFTNDAHPSGWPDHPPTPKRRGV